ncbi:lysophospholipid acyltransferase family protein [Orenia marismortui]|uniref:lysophospholipid acyltransferase family protein n=1 Tax=Orenia marismortui TaxID=46469 RepID=UPI00037187AD|nr:lysophospholipid acyltransferase family protein [Orenia marismortui]
MIKTISWFTYFWLYQIALLGSLIKMKFLELKGEDDRVKNYTNQLAKNWAKSLVDFTGSEIIVKGEDKIPEEPVLFVANHQGSFDIPLLLGYINKPKAFIAKWELRYMPFVSSWMKNMKCIFIKRNDFRQTLRAFKDAGKVFDAGQSLVIFPEGTRSCSNKLGDFKRGSLKIALREEVAIVPVTIKGSYKLREANNGLIKGDKVELILSDPIYVESLSKEQRNDLTLIVREKIKSNL